MPNGIDVNSRSNTMLMKATTNKQFGDDLSRHTALRSSRSAIDLLAKAPLAMSYREMGRWFGIPNQTLSSWGGSSSERLRLFICKLGLMNKEDRERFLDQVCPQYPTVQHDFFEGDPFARQRLTNLAEKKSGLTTVTGATVYWKTFVAFALGHSALTSDFELSGLVTTATNDFSPAPSGKRCSSIIPIPGVLKLTNVSISGRARLVRDFLMHSQRSISKRRCVVLCVAAQDLAGCSDALTQLAKKCHVIVSTEEAAGENDFVSASAFDRVHVMTSPTSGINPVGQLKLRYSSTARKDSHAVQDW